MMKLYNLSLLLLHVCYAIAGSITWTEMDQNSAWEEINTCFSAVYNLDWDYTPVGLNSLSSSWDASCGYQPATGSFLLCSYVVGGNSSKRFANVLNAFELLCSEDSSYNYTAADYETFFENASLYYVPVSELNTSALIYSPTVTNITKLLNSFHSYEKTYFTRDSGTWFSVGVYGFFLLLAFVSTIYNFLRRVGFTKIINKSRFAKFIQKFILYPTVLPNGKYVQPYGIKYISMLVPNRIEFLTDLFLFGLHVAYFCVTYTTRVHLSWTHHISMRAGITAIGKFPLLVLFAGRNNFLQYLTGWSYATFLHYHKILVLWMSVEALVHSVGYTIYYLGRYVKVMRRDLYFSAGIAASVICGVMILQSLYPLRKFSYEIFVTLHVSLALSFFVLCWYHIRDYGWMEWMVAVCCVWFLERLLRWIRMGFFGYRTATIIAVGDHLMKLEVPKPSWWFQSPGTHGFVYFANIIFWQNNPFTITVQGEKLVSYIKVKKGVTSRIWKTLSANNNQITWKVCIEGPYGGSNWSRVNKYDDVLLVTGGAGAPGILEAASRLKNGKLVWVSQTLDLVTVYDSLIENIEMTIDLYITQEAGVDKSLSKRELFLASDSDAKSSEDSDKALDERDVKGDHCSEQINITYGKPDLESIVNQSVTESNSSAFAILACGPPRLMDGLRNIFTSHVDSWNQSVDFLDDFQTW